jgi:hypothetical protein
MGWLPLLEKVTWTGAEKVTGSLGAQYMHATGTGPAISVLPSKTEIEPVAVAPVGTFGIPRILRASGDPTSALGLFVITSCVDAGVTVKVSVVEVSD